MTIEGRWRHRGSIQMSVTGRVQERTIRTYGNALTSKWILEWGSVPEFLPVEELGVEVGLEIVPELELGSGAGCEAGEGRPDDSGPGRSYSDA